MQKKHERTTHIVEECQNEIEEGVACPRRKIKKRRIQHEEKEEKPSTYCIARLELQNFMGKNLQIEFPNKLNTITISKEEGSCVFILLYESLLNRVKTNLSLCRAYYSLLENFLIQMEYNQS